jgi:hypothetical protein
VREVLGRDVVLTFEIVDTRPRGPSDRGTARRYDIAVSLGTCAVAPLLVASFDLPGVYTVSVELPRPMLASLVVQCVNEHGQAAAASLTVSYNRNVLGALKWMAALPLFLVALALAAAPEKRFGQSELPS